MNDTSLNPKFTSKLAWQRLRTVLSGGIGKRIFVTFVGLLLVIQFTVQFVTRSSIEGSVELNLRRELESNANVLARLVDQNAQRLSLGTTVLASDFGFRSAVLSDDVDTISSALENSGARIGATVTGLVNTSFRLMALGDIEQGKSLQTVLESLAQSMAKEEDKSRITLVNGRLHQFVLVPLRAPVVVAWIIMGFPIDEDLSRDMVSLTSTDLLITQDDGQGRKRLLHSSLAVPGDFDFSRLALPNHKVEINGAEYELRYASEKIGDAGVSVVLLRPYEQARLSFQRMKGAILVIDGLGLLIFAIGSLAIARRVSRPLILLVADTVRVGEGDYATPIEDFGRNDEVGDLARSFDNMRQSIQASQFEVRQLAYWDRLTGLPNRAQFRESLQAVLADTARPCRVLTVILLDLDRFKHINDVLGFAFGDKVLQAIATRLKRMAELDGTVVARMGGGQFAMLLRDCDVASALLMTQKIAASLETPVAFDGQTVDLRAGMGVACWPEHASDVDVLLGYAEVAMYAAKRKNAGAQVYDPVLDSGSALTLSLLSELRQAIDQNELRLFLQPKIALQSHEVIAAEALVRWQHPKRGMVPPMEFIPFAEQTGFVRHLTIWMLEEAARQWHSLQPATGRLRIAINLSTRDLMDQEFPAKVEALLSRHNVPRDGFCLEITESAIMDDPERAEATLNQLSASGYKLSIDDFGTGYSSLAYLKRLPVNELKIDKSFVMGMEKSQSDAQIVRSTIDLAHNLGLSVVAEGVENLQVYELLRELNCDEGQGYYMSRPLPSADFTAWRDRWTTQSR
jgi:diguanylate cyclase (GGDEF)-like protein